MDRSFKEIGLGNKIRKMSAKLKWAVVGGPLSLKVCKQEQKDDFLGMSEIWVLDGG